MAERHSTRATRALQKLSEVDPAFASLSLWCNHRDAEAGEGPAWTDGRTIFYRPPFEALSLDEQIGLAAHHILHVAFRHVPRARAMFARFGDRYDEKMFNLATDAIVNQTLLLSGYILPRPCVELTGVLKGALDEDMPAERAIGRYDAETLYVALMQGRQGKPGGREGARGQAGGTGKGKGRGGGNEGQESEGAAARAADYAERQGFAPDLDASDAEAGQGGAAEDAEWRQRLARAMAEGRLAGTGIGMLGHRIADIPEPHTPWEVVLRGLLARAVQHDPRRTYQRPTRRWIALEGAARAAGGAVPVYEPGTVHRRDAPKIAVGIDSSASIDKARLALFAAQVAGIGRRTGAEVHVLVFDTIVHAHELMTGADWESRILDIAFSREGGTSFVEVIDHAARLAPSAIVILTDLEGVFGPKPGRVPVIWAVPGEVPSAPPFGRVLALDR
ncbi:putative metal-dependent peptidase [Rhodovulum iodosum]|uniref:Metal-dependent peptidase n=1 Tax=Rhodovulum iodosum TaxID=68291 RepID=A0ABV3XQF1_9RHOB|nr:VWA-like domain-containing protein [Rhodovulum robiginosum]RSK31389.1 hypothetical protein EJA01_14685 [Rhodovulum robiginosum]